MKYKRNKALYHHGIRGQKWGVKNGPPYPLGGGDYSESEKKAVYRERMRGNSIYEREHFDQVIPAKPNVRLTTLSYDKDRTKNTDMFYAAYKNADKHKYNAMFNDPIPDDNGYCLKYRIDHKVKHDIKVASEDSGAKIFMNLYKKDRDFYNFIKDENRLEKCLAEDKDKFKGYKASREVLHNIRDPKHKVTEEELRSIYRTFNYAIPYDKGDLGKDVFTQRAKFFDLCKKNGYGACLDVNDAIYGSFKAEAPVIVFDQTELILDKIERSTPGQKRKSKAINLLNALGGG